MDSGITIGGRIKAEREAQGISRKDLAARCKIPYPTLAGIENADQESTTRLHVIADSLGVNVAWLETGKGPRYRADAAYEPGWTSVKGYAQAVGLGAGADAQEYAETHKLKFRAESLARKRLNPEKLAVMYGKGDSMLPRVRPGDAVLFDQSDRIPKDGRLYVIMVNGGTAEYQVKRCMDLDGSIYFVADNPAGDHGWIKPRRMDDKRHPIEVVGRVRWIGSWED